MTETWRHKNRGTEYTIVGEAGLQASAPQLEGDVLVIYRGSDGRLWARPKTEFHDGRFERVAAPTKPAKLDAKFYGEIRKVKDGSVVPDDEYIVFLAKDNALPDMLASYYWACKQLGADEEQLDAVERLIHRVNAWRDGETAE